MRTVLHVVLVLAGVFNGAPTVSRAQADAAAPLDILLFVDDLHLAFRNTPRTRDLVKRLMERVMQPGDQWSVVTTGTSAVSQVPTTDSRLVASQVQRITGNRLGPADVLADMGRSGRASELHRRAEVAFSTATDALAAQTGGVPVVAPFDVDRLLAALGRSGP
jgi:hypothetical protein